jgi:hypothetical protein
MTFVDNLPNGPNGQHPFAAPEIPDGVVVEIDGLGYLELGQSGLRRWSGYVNEEFLQHLQGTRGVQVYREMRDNDPIIGAILQAIDTLVRQVEWRVESPGKEDDGRVEFLQQCIDDMSHTWEDFISEVMSMLPYGWSFFEIVYKLRRGPQAETPQLRSRYDDDRIAWRKFALRAQDTLAKWVFDDHGGIRGFWQYAIPRNNLVYIPIEKALLFRTTTYKNSPEGRSILRNAYRPWYFKKRIEEIEAIGVERDLAGLPIAYVDPAILSPDAAAGDVAMRTSIEKLVKNVRRDQQEGVVFPRVYDQNNNLVYEFQLLASAGTRQFPTDPIIRRYAEHIAMTVLADFVLLGHKDVGSYALSSDKTNIFSLSLGSLLKTIAGVINRHAIPRLLEVNGMELEDHPEIVPGDIEQPDLTQLSDFISKLSAAGVPFFPDPELEKYLRAAAKLPEMTDEDLAHREEMAELARQNEIESAELESQMRDQQMLMAEGGMETGAGMLAGAGYQLPDDEDEDEKGKKDDDEKDKQQPPPGPMGNAPPPMPPPTPPPTPPGRRPVPAKKQR